MHTHSSYHVARARVVVTRSAVHAAQGFFVGQEQSLVGHEEVGGCKGGRVHIHANGLHETQRFVHLERRVCVRVYSKCMVDEESLGQEKNKRWAQKKRRKKKDVFKRRGERYWEGNAQKKTHQRCKEQVHILVLFHFQVRIRREWSLH